MHVLANRWRETSIGNDFQAPGHRAAIPLSKVASHLCRVFAPEHPLQKNLGRGGPDRHRPCRLSGTGGETPVSVGARSETVQGTNSEAVPRVRGQAPHPVLPLQWQPKDWTYSREGRFPRFERVRARCTCDRLDIRANLPAWDSNGWTGQWLRLAQPFFFPPLCVIIAASQSDRLHARNFSLQQNVRYHGTFLLQHNVGKRVCDHQQMLSPARETPGQCACVIARERDLLELPGGGGRAGKGRGALLTVLKMCTPRYLVLRVAFCVWRVSTNFSVRASAEHLAALGSAHL